MKKILVLCAALMAGGWICAQEKATPAPAPAMAPSLLLRPAEVKAEMYMLQVEPKEMRVGHSATLGGAKHTVFTPARRIAVKGGLEPYSKEEFAKLGLSPDTFADRARLTADKILAGLQPEFIKDDSGKILYAVYRGEEPVYAALLVAPSLAKVFQNIFGKEVWVAAPDRHALYVFPPNQALVNDFAADLAERFETDAFAASEEVFAINAAGEIKAVGTVKD